MNGELLREEKYKKKVRECILRRKNERMYEEDIGRWQRCSHGFNIGGDKCLGAGSAPPPEAKILNMH